jgi:competence protein ComEC
MPAMGMPAPNWVKKAELSPWQATLMPVAISFTVGILLGIGAEIIVRKTAAGVTRLGRGWTASPTGWLMALRGWGQDRLFELLPGEEGTVATALLLGEGSTMTREDWQRYIRTGVIHALAISGLHLVILSGFLWRLLRIAGVNRRQAAGLVAAMILAYALLTGGRPPAVRAAVMVLAFCGGLLLRRPVLASNSLALAWLVVLLINPASLAEPGCQLSFVSVAVLYWGLGPWLRRDPDPLERLVEETRPSWQKLRRLAWPTLLGLPRPGRSLGRASGAIPGASWPGSQGPGPGALPATY